MKIAVPVANGKFSLHFGHCEKFVIADVDETAKIITGEEESTPPSHEPGMLPKWLNEKGVNVIIAGGMGMRAQQLFTQYGIKVVVGAPAENPQTVVLNYLKGTLATGTNICDH
ncbi:MAG: NifB/NifX family molybdenum-iron cluster-binding protein [Chitinispirillaceae bacterium]|nr:NifB/NifX family molybdenum-iron cluster-binding protein [Chitinispirillaceae bacterium]